MRSWPVPAALAQVTDNAARNIQKPLAPRADNPAADGDPRDAARDRTFTTRPRGRPGASLSELEGPAKSRSYASPVASTRRPELPALTPEERARELVVRAERDLSSAEHVAADIISAQRDNDLEAWRVAHDQLGSQLGAAEKSVERARSVDGAPDVAKVEQLEHRMQVLTAEVASLDEPPKGFAEVEHELELLVAIRRRPDGPARTGFEQKEADVAARFAQLSQNNKWNLAGRIVKHRPTDELAAAFLDPSNLGRDRQERLLGLLKYGARQDTKRAGAHAQGPDSSAPGHAEPAPASHPQAADHAAPADTTGQAEPSRAPSASVTAHTEPHTSAAGQSEVPAPSPAANAAAHAPHAPTTEQPAPHSDLAPSGAKSHGGAHAPERTTGAAGFSRVPATPKGIVVVRAAVDVTVLPAELYGDRKLGELKASATLLVADDRLVIAVDVNDDHWIAWLDATAFLEALTGGTEGAKELGSAARFLHDLPSRIRPSGGRLRVALWGAKPNDSFAVIDLSRAVAGLWHGSLAGLRPVEAQVLLGKAGGVQVFANDAIKASTALPGEPLGGWFELSDERLAAALATDTGKGAGATVWGGAFYEAGVLRVAIKPAEDARTGIVAHIDVTYLLDRLRGLGHKAAGWIAKLTARLKSGASDFLHVLGGRMHFELPDMTGTWFDFDLKLQLPKLWHGNGFHLGGLLPTGFHFDLGGLSLGAMPKLKFPWLSAPTLGSFHVAWQRVARLVEGVASAAAPKLAELAIGLHRIRDLSFGLGIDLSLAWPELGDTALGFEVDLSKLLAKAGAAGQWISKKLHGATDAVQQWIHLGSDGVLRIYDERHADGPMLGFHLLKLLDGADLADLAPTELRWDASHGGKDAGLSIELGEAREAGDPGREAADKTPTGKAAPEKPKGTVIVHRAGLPATPQLAATLALARNATIDVDLIVDGDQLSLWAEAASAVYAHKQAVRSTVGLAAIAAAVKRHLPAGHRADELPIALDREHSKDGPRFTFGGAATDVSAKVKTGSVSGHASWKLEQLLGATDWTALVPTELVFEVAGAGGLQLGKLKPPGTPLGGPFEIKAPELRHGLLHAPDGELVWVGVHHADDVVAISLTRDEAGDEGALAQIHLSFLLRQLERLGAAGRVVLEKLADVVLPSWKRGGKVDVFGTVGELAQAVGARLLKVAKGVLAIDLPGGHFLRWNLSLQLPHLGLDLDLSRLVPEFDLAIAGARSVSVALRSTAEFVGTAVGKFKLPRLPISLPELHLPAMPEVDVAWVGDLLAVSIELGDLFGDGLRSFGFKVSLDSLTAALHRAGAFLGNKARGVEGLRRYLHLGNDGILRIFNPDRPDGDRVGFDLKLLFDGVSPADLIPVELQLEAKGVGSVQLGKLTPPGKPLGGRFEIKAPELRHALLHAPDGELVWVGVHHADDVVAISLTKDKAGDEGALAQIHLSFLLRQLERLGAAGRVVLEKFADAVLPSWKLGGKIDVFGKVRDLAQAVGARLRDVVNGVLAIELPEGHFLRWNLSLQLPHLGLDLDLSRLVPEFDLAIAGAKSVSVALRSTAEFVGTAVGKFKLPKLPISLPELHLPAMPEVDVAWVGDLLAVSIELGDLFGDGLRSFGFKISLDSLTAALHRAGAFLGNKVHDAAALRRLLHFGADGVLRVFDPDRPTGDRVGFDLKQLFDGVSPSDFIPVELHLELGAKGHPAAAELSFGDDQLSAADKTEAALGKTGKNWGKVLVPRPAGAAIATDAFAAPPWLREHLGVADRAKVHASLHLTATDAIAFASVEGSDRGIELRVHRDALVRMVHSVGGAPAPAPGELHLDAKASAARGMLVVSYGPSAKAGAAQVHGHVGWKLARLLADPSLESLVPDELQLARGEASLTIARELDLANLQPRGALSLKAWPWAASALGHDEAEVFSNALVPDARVALVVRDAKAPAAKPVGLEIALGKQLVAAIQHRLHELATQASGAVTQALSKTRGAGVLPPLSANLHVVPGAAGITVEQGKAGASDYMYARFGWHHLAALAGGDASITGLVPDDFRIATRSMSLEVNQLEVDASRPLPANAREIAQLHPLLRDSLTSLGLSGAQWLDLDLGASKVTDPETKRLQAVGHVYDVAGEGPRESRHVTGGKQIAVGMSLEALLAQVLPAKRAWAKQPTKPSEPAAGHTSMSAAVSTTNDVNHDGNANDPGVEMAVSVAHKNRSGELRAFSIEAGWSLEQILNLLMHLDSIAGGDGHAGGGAAGYLAPSRLAGAFETSRFKITFGTIGGPSKYHCLASDLPGLDTLLGAVLDPASAAAARLHLNLPSGSDIARHVEEAIKNGTFVDLVGCSLELPSATPDKSRFYGLTLALSPKNLKQLLYLIPYAGQILKVIDMFGSAIKDPVGTAQNLRYAPEVLVDLVENAPEIFGRLKEKGWKGIAMALVMGGDVSAKQAAMAGRIAKKMKALGWKPGDPRPKQLGDVPAEYLEWLSKQDGQSLIALDNYTQLAKAKGIDPGDADYAIPTKLLDVNDLHAKISEVEAGYTTFAHAQHAAEQSKDPAAQQALALQADLLRKRIDRLIQAGAKPSANNDADVKGTERQAAGGDRPFSNVSELPPPSPEEEQSARALFQGDGDGVVLAVQEADYLVHKYAGLTTEQLGQLLATGSTIVTVGDKRIAVPLHEEERAFVRTLFLRRSGLKPSDVANATAQHEDSGPPGTGAPGPGDAKLVAGWHAQQQAATAKHHEPAGAGAGGHNASGATALDDVLGDEGESAGDSAGGNAKHAEGAKGSAHADGAHANAAQGHGASAKPEQPGGAASSAKDGPKPSAGQAIPSFSELTHVPPANARQLVRLERGQLVLDDAVARKLVGFAFHDITPPAKLSAIRLVSQHKSGRGEDELYEFALGFDVLYQGITTPTVHQYVYMPATQTTKDGTFEDPAGFLKKLDAAIVIEGKAGHPSKAATFTHGPYTVQVVNVPEIADYDDSVHFAGETRRAPTGRLALVTAQLKFIRIETNDRTVVVLNSQNIREVVREGEPVMIKAPVLRSH
jgi:hypothetical protein